MLGVGGPGDVGELEEFFDSRKDIQDSFLRKITRFIDNVITLEEFVQNYLPIISYRCVRKLAMVSLIEFMVKLKISTR